MVSVCVLSSPCVGEQSVKVCVQVRDREQERERERRSAGDMASLLVEAD